MENQRMKKELERKREDQKRLVSEHNGLTYYSQFIFEYLL